MLGLNDRHIARVAVTHPGGNWVGHEKSDPAYVLDRAPDLMHFGAPGGGDPVLGYAAAWRDARAFRERYDLCNFAAPAAGGRFVARIWTRRDSRTIGIRTMADSVVVPSYLLNISGHAIARLDAGTGFVIECTAQAPVGVRRLFLTAGEWVMAEPSHGVRLRLRDAGAQWESEEQPDDRGRFVIARAGSYDVLVVAKSAAVHLPRLVLRRLHAE
jgi:hypothetical protein